MAQFCERVTTVVKKADIFSDCWTAQTNTLRKFLSYPNVMVAHLPRRQRWRARASHSSRCLPPHGFRARAKARPDPPRSNAETGNGQASFCWFIKNFTLWHLMRQVSGIIGENSSHFKSKIKHLYWLFCTLIANFFL